MGAIKALFGRAPAPLKIALAPASLKDELLCRSRVFFVKSFGKTAPCIFFYFMYEIKDYAEKIFYGIILQQKYIMVKNILWKYLIRSSNCIQTTC
jgi:hypothetical protein